MRFRVKVIQMQDRLQIQIFIPKTMFFLLGYCGLQNNPLINCHGVSLVLSQPETFTFSIIVFTRKHI